MTSIAFADLVRPPACRPRTFRPKRLRAVNRRRTDSDHRLARFTAGAAPDTAVSFLSSLPVATTVVALAVRTEVRFVALVVDERDLETQGVDQRPLLQLGCALGAAGWWRCGVRHFDEWSDEVAEDPLTPV